MEPPRSLRDIGHVREFNRSEITFSTTLEIIGNSEMALQLLNTVLSSFFKIGIILAIFKFAGNTRVQNLINNQG